MKIKLPQMLWRRWIVISTLAFLSGCTNLFYFPNDTLHLHPQDLNLNYKDIWIESPNQPKLHGWFLAAKPPAKATILHLHGNGDNISAFLPSIYTLPNEGFNVLTIDYRGYGISEGSIDIVGIHTDIKRSIDWLQANHHAPIILYGQSIGATMGLYVASLPQYQHAFQKIIVEAPFSDYQSIARSKIHWFFYPFIAPFTFFIRDDFSPLSRINDIPAEIPVLFIGSDADTIVPFEMTKKLYDQRTGKKDLWVHHSAAHIDFMREQKNRERLIEFFNKTREA